MLGGATEGLCCSSEVIAQGFVQSGLKNLRGWRQHRLCTICSAICLSYFPAPCLWKNPKLLLAGCTEMVTEQQWKNLRAEVITHTIPRNLSMEICRDLLKMTGDGKRISFNAFLTIYIFIAHFEGRTRRNAPLSYRKSRHDFNGNHPNYLKTHYMAV